MTASNPTPQGPSVPRRFRQQQRTIALFNTSSEWIPKRSVAQICSGKKAGSNEPKEADTNGVTDGEWAAIAEFGEPVLLVKKPDAIALQQNPLRCVFTIDSPIGPKAFGVGVLEFPAVVAADVTSIDAFPAMFGPVQGQWYLGPGVCWPAWSLDPTLAVKIDTKDGKKIRSVILAPPVPIVCYGQAWQTDQCVATVDDEPDAYSSENGWSALHTQSYLADSPIRMAQAKTQNDLFPTLVAPLAAGGFVELPDSERIHTLLPGLASANMAYGVWGLKPRIAGRYKVDFSASVQEAFTDGFDNQALGVTVGAYTVDANEKITSGAVHGAVSTQGAVVNEIETPDGPELPGVPNVSGSCFVEVRPGQEIIMRVWHELVSPYERTDIITLGDGSIVDLRIYVNVGMATMSAVLVQPFVATDTFHDLEIISVCQPVPSSDPEGDNTDPPIPEPPGPGGPGGTPGTGIPPPDPDGEGEGV